MAYNNMYGARLLVLLLTISSLACSEQILGPGPDAGFSENSPRPSLQSYSSAQDPVIMKMVSSVEMSMPPSRSESAQEQLCCYEGLLIREGCETSISPLSQAITLDTMPRSQILDFSIVRPSQYFSSLNSEQQYKKYEVSFYSEYRCLLPVRSLSSTSRNLSYYIEILPSSSHESTMGYYEAIQISNSSSSSLYTTKKRPLTSFLEIASYSDKTQSCIVDLTLYIDVISYSTESHEANLIPLKSIIDSSTLDSICMISYTSSSPNLQTIAIEMNKSQTKGIPDHLINFKSKLDSLLKERRVSPTLMTSFLQLPPFSSYSAGSISPVVFRIAPLQPFTAESELKIDLTSGFTLPAVSSGYACKIATLTSACTDGSTCTIDATSCNYDSSSKLLTITGFTVGNSDETQITIQDIPSPPDRSPGLQYANTPGLYSISISLKYSSTYTYTGSQPILIMPSTAPTTASISLAHTSYSNTSDIPNLMTITLRPSSTTFNQNDTIDIFFPLRSSNGLSTFTPTLGLCRRYDISSSAIACMDKYTINSNDKIPCMDKTNPDISIICKIIIGKEKSYTPTIIKVQIGSGSANEINLSLLTTTPRVSGYGVGVIMNLAGSYQGASINLPLTLASVSATSRTFSLTKSTSGGDDTYSLVTDKVDEVSKILVYLGPTIHRVPNNTPLHADIYSELDILLTLSIVTSTNSISISFDTNKIPGMLGGLSNLYALYIGSDNNLKGYGSLSSSSSSAVTTTSDLSSLYNNGGISLNTISWVKFNIRPNLVTDTNSRITFTIQGLSLMSTTCFFIDSSGNEDSSICSANTTTNIITLSGLSPYTAGSSYAIDISQATPIRQSSLEEPIQSSIS